MCFPNNTDRVIYPPQEDEVVCFIVHSELIIAVNIARLESKIMFFVILLECDKVGVLQSLLDMESNRKRVEGILTNCLIIILHINKERLLVAKMVIVLNFIGQLDRISLERLLS